MEVLGIRPDGSEIRVSETNYCQKSWNEFTMLTNEERSNYSLIEKFLSDLKSSQ